MRRHLCTLFKDRPRGISRVAFFAMLVLAFSAVTFAAEPEFGGFCTMELVNHQLIKTNCKINWTSRDGRLYCFSNDSAKAEFLKSTDENIQKATDSYATAEAEDTAKGMEKFTSDDAQAFVDKLIRDRSARNGGIFVVDDPVTETSVPVVYDKVDFTRTLAGYGFFPDVIFHAKGDAAQQYLVDFWVVPRNDELTVLETRIYESPIKEGGKWQAIERQPQPWWWIPASEHAGVADQTSSWEVMSAMDRYIATASEQGILSLKDDKTGEKLALRFLDLHQPVRRLKQNGQFFACTDFRKAGTKDQFYDVDFWIGTKSGKMSVTDVKVHKVPVLINGHYVQMSRYHFDPKTFDIVP
ncbi:MAG: hypothetical protein ACREPW_08415 [Candidatus Binataceae bacterium]